MKKENRRCDHIGILTDRSERLVNFYVTMLGFKKEKEEILAKAIIKQIFGISANCKFIRLVMDEVIIEIFEPISSCVHARINSIIGYNHWGYCVADKKRFIQSLKRRKVNIIEVKRNEHVVYFVRDPDGNLVEIRNAKKV